MNKLINWKLICICSLISIALFFVCYFGISEIKNDTWRIFLLSIIFTVSTVLLASVLWESIAKYSFAVQIKKLVGISSNIDSSGIETIFINFLRINWEEELESAKKLEIVFVYAKTWRESNRDILEKFMTHSRKIELLVPTPTVDEYMQEFDRRFSYESGKTKELVTEAIIDFLKMGATVYVFNHSLQASYYKVNDACYMSFFNHKKPEKGSVPAIKAKKGGSFYNYINEEINTIKSQSKQVKSCSFENDTVKLELVSEEKKC